MVVECSILHFQPQMHNTWKCLQSIDGQWLYEAIR